MKIKLTNNTIIVMLESLCPNTSQFESPYSTARVVCANAIIISGELSEYLNLQNFSSLPQ